MDIKKNCFLFFFSLFFLEKVKMSCKKRGEGGKGGWKTVISLSSLLR